MTERAGGSPEVTDGTTTGEAGSSYEFSLNERAGAVMGLRPTDGIAFDEPCELGYWCPVCKVPPSDGETFDDRLHWSEYRGFVWCSACDKDYPSALCVPLDLPKDPERPWVYAGPDDAVTVFLDTVEGACGRVADAGQQGGEALP